MKLNLFRLGQICLIRLGLLLSKHKQESKYFSKEYFYTYVSSLFDRRFYKKYFLSSYDKSCACYGVDGIDCSKIDPVEHYIKYGWRLGCSPSKKFHNDIYLQKHPDLIKKDESPLYNYMTHRHQPGIYRFKYDPVVNAEVEYPEIDNSQKNILIVSHELSNTGAPMVMVDLVVALKELGYGVMVVCPLDGPIRYKLEEQNVTVIVDEHFFLKLQIQRPTVIDFVKKFSLVWFNTAMYGCYSEFVPKEIKTVCWIHENSEFLSHCPYDLNKLKRFTKALSVSSYVQRTLKELIDLDTDTFLYGVDLEKFNSATKPTIQLHDKHKLVFCSVGSSYIRKGMDLFAQYIEVLPEKIKSQCVFEIIGKNTDHDKFDNLLFRRNPELKVYGELNHELTLKHIQSCDVYVCLSRDDPFPTTVSEAAAFKKVVMCSENCGQYGLIEDHVTGFKVNNSGDFVEAVSYAVNNRDKLETMANKFNETYLPLIDSNNFKIRTATFVSKILSDNHAVKDVASKSDNDAEHSVANDEVIKENTGVKVHV